MDQKEFFNSRIKSRIDRFLKAATSRRMTVEEAMREIENLNSAVTDPEVSDYCFIALEKLESMLGH